MEEVQKLQTASSKQQIEFLARINKLEDEITRKDEQISNLNTSLSKQSNYEEIRKELEYVYFHPFHLFVSKETLVNLRPV